MTFICGLATINHSPRIRFISFSKSKNVTFYVFAMLHTFFELYNQQLWSKED